MFYYPHHIGDYRSATAHLSNEEDLAYRRLLDMYYDTEKPIPADTQWVARRIRVATDVVEIVLRDFFVLTDDGWRSARADREIAGYHAKAEIARSNGKKGGRKKTQQEPSGNPVGSDPVPTGSPVATGSQANQEPVTKNQEPATSVKPRATRLAQDWVLPDDWADWARGARPDLNISDTADRFRDFWVAKAGKDGAKLDWLATWRNWVRNSRGGTSGGFQPVNKQAAIEQRNQAAMDEWLAQQGAIHEAS